MIIDIINSSYKRTILSVSRALCQNAKSEDSTEFVGWLYFGILKHWNFVYFHQILALEFGILKHWTFVYPWFMYWNFVYSLNTHEIVITWLSYMPNQSTGISYIETLDFRILLSKVKFFDIQFTSCFKFFKLKDKTLFNKWWWSHFLLCNFVN